ncbi:hypothetical protein L7F22_042623 [Adiantum nelumboides]|nr:hypothetical protein [Adiantum nelumboides]
MDINVVDRPSISIITFSRTRTFKQTSKPDSNMYSNYMRMLTVVLGLVLLLSSADATSTWSLCSSTEDYNVAVKGVTINPDPVVRGSEALFEIPAVTEETIEGGSVTIQVYYLGMRVHTEEDDLCVRTSCPIAPGDFSIKSKEGLPSYTPPGAYRLDMRIHNLNGDLLTCLKINFRITAPDTFLGF